MSDFTNIEKWWDDDGDDDDDDDDDDIHVAHIKHEVKMRSYKPINKNEIKINK